eukprot:GABV01014494.1.p1 GENE.GABV01014494.1~~GABV01014494.1.p1  ORF type:complete len:120 (-),score=50.95 GABV01014494.1:3-317(-)
MHISGEIGGDDDSKSIIDIIEQRILSSAASAEPFDPAEASPAEFLGNPDAILEMTEEEQAHLQQRIDEFYGFNKLGDSILESKANSPPLGASPTLPASSSALDA